MIESTTAPPTLTDPPDWELVFRFTSDRVSLSMCATVGERWRRSFERLRSPDDLARWLVMSGLLDSRSAVTDAELADAQVLREAIYRLVRASMSGQVSSTADREVLNTWARRPSLSPQLGADGVLTSWSGDTPVRCALATVARDAIQMLGGPDVHRVRECAAVDCALLFLDRSRPGRRQWCSDGACGAKSRAASYRRRRRATESV